MSPRLVADLHLHSRFSMATSRNLGVVALAEAARAKGIDLLVTGDFTHPEWLAELRASLADSGDGVYETGGVRFVLGTELCCIWRQAGRSRRVHVLVLAPGFDAAARIARALSPYGRLTSNGRPVLKLSARDLVTRTRDAAPSAVIIPAHVWTPWYGVYGSKSGFDSLDECFGDVASEVRAIETGLSSDPAMNWRVSELEGRAILSFSDAHSAANLGRELTVFEAEPTYPALRAAIESGDVLETVEFHPEHGKYHYDGHRRCGLRFSPGETRQAGGTCPRCGRPMTLGVLHRVEELADIDVAVRQDRDGLVRGPANRPPFRLLLPLREVLSQTLGVGKASKRVERAYEVLVADLGGEYRVLVDATRADIKAVAGEVVAVAVTAARAGRVKIEPGYDGAWGTVRIEA